MSERVDFKLRHVALATYAYRHEAELAAGFLADAGIPYRLQVDDPALGMTIATPATLWVHAIDLRAAREVLELPAGGGAAEAPPREGETDAPTGNDALGAGRYANLGGGGPAHLRVVRHPPASARRPGALGAAERLLALGVAGGAAAAAVRLPDPVSGAFTTAVLWGVAAVFALAAVTGRTLPPLARLLRAVSGGAPGH